MYTRVTFFGTSTSIVKRKNFSVAMAVAWIPFSGGHYNFKWQQSANAHNPISSSPSQSSTLLKWNHLENKNSSIFLTTEWNCTLITSFGPDCKEYIKVVSNFDRVSMAFWGSGSRVLLIHYGMAHFVAMDIMIGSTPILSIFLAKGVYFRRISQNHSNKKGLMINEF